MAQVQVSAVPKDCLYFITLKKNTCALEEKGQHMRRKNNLQILLLVTLKSLYLQRNIILLLIIKNTVKWGD